MNPLAEKMVANGEDKEKNNAISYFSGTYYPGPAYI
jgi:hypothetical protein